MKIIIISDCDPRTKVVGGVGVYAKKLAQLLAKDHEVIFIGKKMADKPKERVSYKVIIANDHPGQNNTVFAKSLIKLAPTLPQVDVIHAQRPDWLYPFRNVKGKKVVTLHGSHHKNMRLKQPLHKQLLYHLVMRQALQSADRIIAVDFETRKEFEERYSFLQNKIVTIPIGVESDYFKPGDQAVARKKLRLPLASKMYLVVARLEAEKRIDLMITHLQKGEMLLVVGTGREEKKLRALSKGKNVKFFGAVPHKELNKYYQAADYLLLWSTHEGLPTVVLESWCCNTPVIATPVGELPRLVNNKNGLLVENDFRKALLDAQKKTFSACRKTALRFDWNNIVKRIIKEAYV